MKKIFAIIVLISLVFVMAACKAEEKKGYSQIEQPSSSTETTNADTTTTNPGTAQTTNETKAETPIIPITETPAENAPVTEVKTEIVNESYYTTLYQDCKSTGFPDCCNQSVDKMKAGNFKLSSDINCPTGYSSDRLTCMGSLRWCVPTVKNSEMFCDATADCVPKPICHPLDCINKKFEGNYTMPASCPLPYYVDRAYKVDDCECINNKCTNKKA